MTELPKPAVLAARGGCWFRAGTVEIHLGVEAGFAPALQGAPGHPSRDPWRRRAHVTRGHRDLQSCLTAISPSSGRRES